jgi:hypothetical protein
MRKSHKTKDGREIKISDLETTHLENIIKMINEKSKKGLIVRTGGGSCAEDIWYDEEIVYGDEVKNILNYSDYEDELNRRLKYDKTKLHRTKKSL